MSKAALLQTVRSFVIATLVAIGSTTAASAQSFEYDAAIDALEMQRMFTHRMVAEAVLVALDFERESNIARLTRSRDQFDQTMRRFRDADSEIGARVNSDPEISERVYRAAELWQSLNQSIGDHVAAEAVTPEQVGQIVDLGESLHDVFRGLDERLELTAGAGAHSMLKNAVEAAVRLETLSQQMTKEFLLIAYGHQPARNRTALRLSAEQFHTDLLGLMQGDIDKRLLPAPTPEIEAQLQRVERLWQEEYRPMMDRAIDVEEIDAADLARAMRATRLLVQEVESALRMYRAL